MIVPWGTSQCTPWCPGPARIAPGALVPGPWAQGGEGSLRPGAWLSGGRRWQLGLDAKQPRPLVLGPGLGWSGQGACQMITRSP
jgi:hypothetical protein